MTIATMGLIWIPNSGQIYRLWTLNLYGFVLVVVTTLLQVRYYQRDWPFDILIMDMKDDRWYSVHCTVVYEMRSNVFVRRTYDIDALGVINYWVNGWGIDASYFGSSPTELTVLYSTVKTKNLGCVWNQKRTSPHVLTHIIADAEADVAVVHRLNSWQIRYQRVVT
jgi:hypothetical protein